MPKNTTLKRHNRPFGEEEEHGMGSTSASVRRRNLRLGTSPRFKKAATSTTISTEEDDNKPQQHDPVTFDVLTLTEKELQELSLEDQEQVVHDLYGFCNVVDETRHPNFVEDHIQALLKELEKMPPRSKQAYQLALETDVSYTHSRELLLAFLRADRFEPTAAAHRMVTHLEQKLHLFGPELLCKDIEQDDLDDVSRNLLMNLPWYVDLPVRDRAGRQIVLLISNGQIECDSLPIEARMKVLFYTMAVAARDPETQIHGRVYVMWVAGHLGKAANLWQLAQLQAGALLRHQGIHMCIDKRHGYSLPMVSIAQMALKAFLRVRVRRHIGYVAELKYALMTYGIPTEFIPIRDESGDYVHQLHADRWKRIGEQEEWRRQCLKRRAATAGPCLLVSPPSQVAAGKTAGGHATDLDSNLKPLEASTADATPESKRSPIIIDTPSNNDVLMGKGRGVQNHVGNVRFRKLIDKSRPQYDQATKRQKTLLAKDIVRVVQEEWNGRFLKEDKKGWMEMTNQLKVRQKVSSCFRDKRKEAPHSSDNPNSDHHDERHANTMNMNVSLVGTTSKDSQALPSRTTEAKEAIIKKLSDGHDVHKHSQEDQDKEGEHDGLDHLPAGCDDDLNDPIIDLLMS